MKVSVVIANYNMGCYLTEAVESVLAQDHSDLEIIIVDDGSTDPETKAALDSYRGHDKILIVEQENKGQSSAKNVGAQHAKGDLLGYCDSDNRWLPGKLSAQIDAFSNPKIGLVYGNLIKIDEHGQDQGEMHSLGFNGSVSQKLLRKNFVYFNTVLVRRDLFVRAGGFDETLAMAIDYDLWLRVSTFCEFLHLAQPLAEYRIWGGQMSKNVDRRIECCMKIYEKLDNDLKFGYTKAQTNLGRACTQITFATWLAGQHRKKEALQAILRANRLSPFNFSLLRDYLYAIKRIVFA